MDLDKQKPLELPHLVLLGQDDSLISAKAVKKKCVSNSNCELHIIPGARHELLIEKQEIVSSVWKKINKFLVVDEQTPSGNLSSCVFEGFSEKKFFPKIISKCLPEEYFFENGGREYLLGKNGLSNKDILKATNSFR